MGFNTSMIILNDALSYIKDDLKFGEKVYYACQNASLGKSVDIPSGSYVNAATVAESHHADGMLMLIFGGNDVINTGVSAYCGGHRDKVQIEFDALKMLADKHGYSLRKKNVRHAK
jgi:hypothetical protein